MTTHTLHYDDCRIRSGALAVLAWILTITGLGASGLLAADSGWAQLLMPATIVLPVAAFALAWRYSAGVRDVVLAADTGLLVSLHGFRLLGGGFLFLYAFDVLPGLLAWPAGLGDMLAAAGACIIGTALLRGNPVSRRTLLAWNTFGLLDFLVAVVIGTALRSHYLGGTVPTDAMAQLPLSLVPTLVVPLYVITHLVIYLQLRR